MTKTFEEIAKDPAGTIYDDAYENGVRYIILRGPSALCAYVGVPISHPLAGKDYDSIPLSVHGGLTYAKAGSGGYLPEGMYWYGWDYAHAGDTSFYDLTYGRHSQSKDWTVEMVRSEIWSATYDFEKLMRLAESIANKQPA